MVYADFMHILFWFLISEGESINYNPIFSVEREGEGGEEVEVEGGGGRCREYKYFKLTELCLAPPAPSHIESEC